jgi:hypothetical protein
VAPWQERTAEILKIIDAFSKASEYWAVDFRVKASNLADRRQWPACATLYVFS